MAIQQISVFLENKPGKLDSMTEVLANANIDLRAMSLAETTDFGIVRMIVDDPYDTVQVLKDNGFICRLTPVIAVLIPDEVGGLNKAVRALCKASVNVEYMYASLSGRDNDSAYMIFRVANVEKSEAALHAAGIRIMDQEDTEEM